MKKNLIRMNSHFLYFSEVLHWLNRLWISLKIQQTFLARLLCPVFKSGNKGLLPGVQDNHSGFHPEGIILGGGGGGGGGGGLPPTPPLDETLPFNYHKVGVVNRRLRSKVKGKRKNLRIQPGIEPKRFLNSSQTLLPTELLGPDGSRV